MYPLTRRNLLPMLAAFLVGLAFMLAPHRGAADDDDRNCAGVIEDERDHDRARRALECGEVMPLAEVLAIVRPHISGEIVETEFENEDGVWVYELKYIDARGRLGHVYVDGRTGRILNIEDD